NQGVVGSNPASRAIFKRAFLREGPFSLRESLRAHPQTSRIRRLLAFADFSYSRTPRIRAPGVMHTPAAIHTSAERPPSSTSSNQANMSRRVMRSLQRGHSYN